MRLYSSVRRACYVLDFPYEFLILTQCLTYSRCLIYGCVENIQSHLFLLIACQASQWAAAAAKSLQSCPTLCDPVDSSPPGSPIPGILQARILDWVAISSSNALKWKVKMKSLSPVRLLATPWTAAYQAPPFMGFVRQEYWSGVPLPSPRKGPTHVYFF